MVVKFETYYDGEFWCAKGTNYDIFTQGKTYEELLKNIKEAASLHFEEELKNNKLFDILVMNEMEVGIAEIATG